jgi:hypothetical protein
LLELEIQRNRIGFIGVLSRMVFISSGAPAKASRSDLLDFLTLGLAGFFMLPIVQPFSPDVKPKSNLEQPKMQFASHFPRA